MTEAESSTPPVPTADGGASDNRNKQQQQRQRRRRGPPRQGGGAGGGGGGEKSPLGKNTAVQPEPLVISTETTENRRGGRNSPKKTPTSRGGRPPGRGGIKDDGKAPDMVIEIPVDPVIEAGMGEDDDDDEKKEPMPNSRKRRNRRQMRPTTPKKEGNTPSIRIRVGLPSDKAYTKPRLRDDVVLVPNMFGTEDDLSVYERLVSEIAEFPSEKANTPWHQGSQLIVKEGNNSTTFQEIVDRVCEYFNVKKDSIATKLIWYQDSKDWQPYEDGAKVWNEEQPKNYNITIGVNLGACRELALLKTEEDVFVTKDEEDENCTIYIPQENNSVISLGRGVSARFKHGTIALPEKDQDDNNGRISIILCGWANRATKQPTGPHPTDISVVDSTAATETGGRGNNNKLTKKQEKRKEQRKAWRLKKIEQRRSDVITKTTTEGDGGCGDGVPDIGGDTDDGEGDALSIDTIGDFTVEA